MKYVKLDELIGLNHQIQFDNGLLKQEMIKIMDETIDD